jgi:hypothetical protein
VTSRALLAAVAILSARVAAADSLVELRVIVPRAAVRSGPAFSYRELYRAERGEVLKVLDRNGEYWFRVQVPDGRLGWIYGEQVLPFTVDLGAPGAPSRWERFKDAVFAPSPIVDSHVSLAFSGGALSGDGMFMFRPAATLDAHFAVEGHLGEAIGADGSLLLYGAGGQILIWPLGPVVPFVTVGGGGATSFPKVNGVTQASKTQFALDAGGGLVIIFKKKIAVRADVRNYTLFTPNSTTNRQEYSGGLAVYF